MVERRATRLDRLEAPVSTFHLAIAAFGMCYIASYRLTPMLTALYNSKQEGRQ